MSSRNGRSPEVDVGEERPLQLLLVEDSPDHTELVVRSFRASLFGGEISSCGTIAEAKRALEEFEPDLIIADMRLPDGEGTDLIEGPDGRRPVVMMTSFGNENQAVHAIKSGALDYVVKNELSFAELPEICRRAVRDWRVMTEKMAAQEALGRSEERYRKLFESVPAGIFQCDVEGRIMTANPAMAGMLGYAGPGALAGLSLLGDVIAGGRDAPASVSDLNHSGETPELEVEMWKADGGKAIVLLTIRELKPDGHPSCYEGFCFDITRRRRADEVLAETRLQFEATFRGAFGFTAIVDNEGRVRDINDAVLQATGCEMGQLVGKYFWEMPFWQGLEGEPETARAGVEKALGGDQHRDQTNFRAADGSIQVADRSFTPVRDKSGELKFVVVEGRDVTDLLKTAKRLEQSEGQFRTLFENAPEAVVVLDMEPPAFVDLNRNAELLFEAPREKLLGMSPADLSPKIQPGGGLSADLARHYLHSAVAGETPVFEWMHQTVTGKSVPCEVRLARLPHGTRSLVRGSVTDISLRKRAEARLRRSQKRMSALVENATAGIIEVSSDGLVVSANPAAVIMLGRNQPGELNGRPYLSQVSDLDRPAVSRVLEDTWSGHDASLTYRIAGLSEERLLCSSFIAIRSADGAVERVMILSDDVTERERNERRLRETKRFTDAIVNSLPGVFYVVNEGRRMIRWNENFATMTGLPRDQIARLDPGTLFEEDERHLVNEEFERVLEEGEGRIEASIRRANGETVPFLLTGVAMRIGKQTYVVGMGFDISERKQFEAQLRTSENYLRSIVESEPECVWTLDRQGCLLDINPAGRLLLGEETVQYLKEYSVASLALPGHRQAFLQLNESVFGGNSGILTFEIKTRRGIRRWLETHAVALRNDSGEVENHLAVTRDVTSKREADRRIREYSRRLQRLSERLLEAQEAERRHVARELHDEVGQSLTALKIDLEAAGAKTENRASRLQDSLRIVERILEQVRGMSLDLRPAILDDLGLLPALRWYADRQTARFGIDISLAADTLTGVRLAAEIETTSFRIVQEALTNVVRHSGASHAQIHLALDDGKLWIQISDNGSGFDAVAALLSSSRSKSFGLLGLQERAALLGGQADISSKDGEGTRIIAWLPLTGWGEETADADLLVRSGEQAPQGMRTGLSEVKGTGGQKSGGSKTHEARS